MKYRTIPSRRGIYLISSVITGHLSIFTNHNLAMVPLTSLSWFRKEQIWRLYAFCLMPNHLHILIRLLNSRPIEKLMGQFHSYTGHQIIDELRVQGTSPVLSRLRSAGFKKQDRKYCVWHDCVAKCVETGFVLLESLEYIHNNPINKKWRLVTERQDYQYSSACYYDLGKPCIIEIDDYRELLGETPSR